jgi:hypothetical protein
MAQALVNYKFVSGDGHVTEPGNLWVERMDRRFRDRAPRVISGTELHTEPGTRTSGMSLDTTNSDFFVIDGLLPVDFIDMIATMANEKAEHSAIAGRGHNRASDSRIGATDPHARLADQDLDNLRAEVLYPNYAMYMFGTPDLEYRRECFRVYNDWLAEYCSVAPDRFLGVAPLPLGGPIEWAVGAVFAPRGDCQRLEPWPLRDRGYQNRRSNSQPGRTDRIGGTRQISQTAICHRRRRYRLGRGSVASDGSLVGRPPPLA